MSEAPGYLLVIPWELDAPGGVSQVVASLHREIRALGWRPMVLVSSWPARTPVFDDSGNVSRLRWRIRSPWVENNRLKGLIAFLLTFPAFGRRWRELARRYDWQVVHVHFPGLSALTWIVLKRLKLWRGVIMISVQGREIRDPHPPRGPIAQRFMRYLIENADAVVTCSTELADDVLRFAPRVGRRVHVIDNGISTDVLRAELDAEFALPADLPRSRFILNVGTFEHKKAQDILVDAFTQVAAQEPDVRLVLIGRATPWLEQIRQRVAAAGIGHRVQFSSNLPHHQVLAYLTHATIFCLPSRAEGHPIALLEAAALGIPVVATPVGGIAATIRDQRHGLLVPVDDVRALANALCRLLRAPDTAAAMGRTLQRLVHSEFTAMRSAQRYIDLARHLGAGCCR